MKSTVVIKNTPLHFITPRDLQPLSVAEYQIRRRFASEVINCPALRDWSIAFLTKYLHKRYQATLLNMFNFPNVSLDNILKCYLSLGM